jgi:hypothetical protein
MMLYSRRQKSTVAEVYADVREKRCCSARVCSKENLIYISFVCQTEN